MPVFYVIAEEVIVRSYAVDAATAEEARACLERGYGRIHHTRDPERCEVIAVRQPEMSHGSEWVNVGRHVGGALFVSPERRVA